MRELVQRKLNEFCRYCDEVSICLSIANLGIEEFRSKFLSLNPDKERTIHIGPKLPSQDYSIPNMNIGDFLEFTKKDGEFSDRLAKSLIITTYASWDEYYRPEIARLAKKEQRKVTSDLMGDLRHIRHSIVHRKSVITNEFEKIKTLTWKLQPGKLHITTQMSDSLAVQLRSLKINILD